MKERAIEWYTAAGLMVVLFASCIAAAPPQVTRFGPDVQYVARQETYRIRTAAKGGRLEYRWWHQEPDSTRGHAIPFGEGFAVDRKVLSVPDAAANRDYDGWYWCVISNRVTGEYTLTPKAYVKVLLPPRIVQHPSDRTVSAGGSTSFTVQADAGAPVPMKYQWYFANRKIPRAIEPTLNLERIRTNQYGYYHCVVTSRGGQTASGGALLRINP